MASVIQNPWFIAGCVLAGLLLVSILSRVASGVRNPVARETIQQTETLLKAANKWALMSEQDSNIVMSLMHICYAKHTWHRCAAFCRTSRFKRRTPWIWWIWSRKWTAFSKKCCQRSVRSAQV